MEISNTSEADACADGLELNLMSKADLKALTHTTTQILEEIGVQTSDEGALKLYSDAGCEVDFDKMVAKIPEDLVMGSIRSAPKAFKFAALDRKKDFKISSGSGFNLGPFAVGVQCMDYGGNGNYMVRDSTAEDLKNATIIADFCENYVVSDACVAARDMEAVARPFHEILISMTNTTKSFAYSEPDGNSFDDYFEMTKIAYGGDEELALKRPLVNVVCCPTSPLTICDNTSRVIIEAAKRNIPNHIISMVMAGGTGPITPEGTLAVHNAEILAGITLSQIVSKGAPVVYGSATTIMDMKTAGAACGSPEMGMFSAAVAKIGQYYNIPSSVAGAWTDSKLPDEQAAFEKGMTGMLPALAGADLLFSGGVLEGGQTLSLEQMVIDNDMFSMFRKLARGFSFSEDNMLFNEIKKTGIGGHFLSKPSTLKRMSEQSSSCIFDRNVRESWVKQGSKDAVAVAHSEVKDILKNHDPCGLDAEIVKDLRRFVKEKDLEYAKY
ncbi:[trimethylamine--corrinoid protein] Co-methyltransferase [Methanococcoides methylutens]|uniref:[trimethylamine--corrinoid protein] Co-methyltransferase n=1 Tax=Methanococcoides methylutens TaxID=2226 RepID=UPI004043C91C